MIPDRPLILNSAECRTPCSKSSFIKDGAEGGLNSHRSAHSRQPHSLGTPALGPVQTSWTIDPAFCSLVQQVTQVATAPTVIKDHDLLRGEQQGGAARKAGRGDRIRKFRLLPSDPRSHTSTRALGQCCRDACDSASVAQALAAFRRFAVSSDRRPVIER